MSEFKIGDKLRCINDDYGWCDAKVGTIWTFSGHPGGDERYVKFEETDKAWPNAGANDYAEHWELVQKPMPELVSGMRVKIRIGLIYTVIKDLNGMYRQFGYMPLSDYDLQNGTSIDGDRGWDIVEIYAGDNYSNLMDTSILGDLLWEEIDPIKEAKEAQRIAIAEKISALHEKIDRLEDELESLKD